MFGADVSLKNIKQVELVTQNYSQKVKNKPCFRRRLQSLMASDGATENGISQLERSLQTTFSQYIHMTFADFFGDHMLPTSSTET